MRWSEATQKYGCWLGCGTIILVDGLVALVILLVVWVLR